MVNSAAISEKPQKKLKKQSNIVLVFKRLLQNKLAVISLAIILLLLLLSFIVPLFIDPDELGAISTYNQAPSAKHIFGTDGMGRDYFARVIVGTRYSLALGFVASVGTAVLGTVLGTIIGYFGGKVDGFFMRVCDVWQAIPGQLLAIIIALALNGGFWPTVLAMSIGGIPMSIRSTRAMCLKERSMEYLEAAQSYNCSKAKIMFKHMLPNIISPTIVGTTMSMGGTIMGAAGLSYIGLGIGADLPEWGAMLSAAQKNFLTSPHLLIFPAIMILIVVLAINIFGDGLRDAMDPKLKK